MASTPLGEDTYPDPLLASERSSAGLWRVVALGVALVALAVAFSFFSDRIPMDLVMTFVGILAVVGVRDWRTPEISSTERTQARRGRDVTETFNRHAGEHARVGSRPVSHRTAA